MTGFLFAAGLDGVRLVNLANTMGTIQNRRYLATMDKYIVYDQSLTLADQVVLRYFAHHIPAFQQEHASNVYPPNTLAAWARHDRSATRLDAEANSIYGLFSQANSNIHHHFCPVY